MTICINEIVSTATDQPCGEMFVYPKNESLREAYIALLGMMKLQKKIHFSVHECVSAIVERFGWITLYNPGDLGSKPDRVWKKATQYLKILEDPFFHFIGPGRIQLHVFDEKTKIQLTNFETYLNKCAYDLYMSEYSSCTDAVIFQKWNDVISCASSDIDIDAEIKEVIAAVPIIKDTMKSNFYNQTDDYNSCFDQCVFPDDIGA